MVSFHREPAALRLRLCRQYLSYLSVRLFICLVQATTMETCQQLARWLATICHDRLRIRRDVVDENLRLAFPELSDDQRDRLGWRMWEHLFILVAEVAHAPRKIHETNWRDYVHFRNGELLCRISLEERPTMIISGHFGNFELGGYIFGILGFPTYAVARTLDNPYLNAFIDRFRGLTGQRIVPKQGGYEQIVEVLAHSGMLTFLADQYAGTKGCWVQFFGRPASAHKAIALFALDNNARLVLGTTRRVGQPLHYEFTVHDVVDPLCLPPEAANVKSLTQWYTSQLEIAIRSAPEQYWWLHRRWKDNRPLRRRNARAAGVSPAA
jgi:Kdo2-lipid IVA lauroyltransferase/acyltransferase